MFENAINVKQAIYFRVTQVTDQLFEFRLYSRVYEEFKQSSICFNRKISLLDEQLNVSRVPFLPNLPGVYLEREQFLVSYLVYIKKRLVSTYPTWFIFRKKVVSTYPTRFELILSLDQQSFWLFTWFGLELKRQKPIRKIYNNVKNKKK